MGTARRTMTTIGAALAVALLAGCAAGALDPDPEDVGQAPSASPTASPASTPSATPDIGPSEAGTVFTTQNGTASFTLPEGWTVVDSSRLVEQNHNGQPQWDNVVQVLDAAGVSRASYYDGYGGDVSASAEVGVVRSLPMAGGATTALAWWSHDPDSGWWGATAAVVMDPADPFPTVRSPAEGRLLSFGADLSAAPECASVVDEATAVACLESPAIAETLAVLATLVPTDVPWDAMPEGVDPQADVPWIDHVSADGAIEFSYPASWSLHVQEVPEGGPERSLVTLVTPDGYRALDIGTSSASGPWRCDPARPDPTAPSIEVLSSEPVDPFANASIDPGGSIAAVTFDAGGGATGVALLHAADAANGCYDPSLVSGSGSVSLASPWGADAEDLLAQRHPGGVGFVGSYEHGVMLDVARSLAVNF